MLVSFAYDHAQCPTTPCSKLTGKMQKIGFLALSSSVWALKPRYSNINVLKAFRLMVFENVYDHSQYPTTPIFKVP